MTAVPVAVAVPFALALIILLVEPISQLSRAPDFAVVLNVEPRHTIAVEAGD